MSQHAAYTNIGQEIVLRCTLSDLDGRSKANLLKALLEEAGIVVKIQRDSEVETLLTEAINTLWNS